MALLEVAIKDEIEAQGFTDSNAQAPSYFAGFEPEDPDFAVTVLPEGGVAPLRTLAEFPNLTVRVRHPSGTEANEFMRLIFLHLQEFSSPNVQGSGIRVGRLTAGSSPVQLGRDENVRQGRWIVQQTFAAIVPRF